MLTIMEIEEMKTYEDYFTWLESGAFVFLAGLLYSVGQYLATTLLWLASLGAVSLFVSGIRVGWKGRIFLAETELLSLKRELKELKRASIRSDVDGSS